MSKPVTVIIAEVIAGPNGVSITDRTPESIKVEAGQALVLKTQYRYEDSSAGSEHFAVRVSGNVGRRSLIEASHRIKDWPFVDDSQWGFIEQRVDALTSGDHDLTATVQAFFGKGADRAGADEAGNLSLTVPVSVG